MLPKNLQLHKGVSHGDYKGFEKGMEQFLKFRIMESFVEIGTVCASEIFGGKNKETAQLVEFIAELIGSIAKAIYMMNRFRKLLTNPAALAS